MIQESVVPYCLDFVKLVEAQRAVNCSIIKLLETLLGMEFIQIQKWPRSSDFPLNYSSPALQIRCVSTI